MAKEKVILAYSGGLDTSVLACWLKETYDSDVIAGCCAGNRCGKSVHLRYKRGIHNRLHMAYPESRRHLRRPVYAGNIHGKASYG